MPVKIPVVQYAGGFGCYRHDLVKTCKKVAGLLKCLKLLASYLLIPLGAFTEPHVRKLLAC